MWTPSPSRVAEAHLTTFRARLSERIGLRFPDTPTLHEFSIREMGRFWEEFWEFAGVIGERGRVAFVDAPDMRDARFFPEARLNVTETLLARDDDAPALLLAGEDGTRASVSWHDLRELVARAAGALQACGVGVGDVVAAWLPNSLPAYVTALAAARIGAIFTSASPEFGVAAVVDRFGQVAPRLLVAVSSYRYAGHHYDCAEKIRAVVSELASLRHVVVVDGVADVHPGDEASRSSPGTRPHRLLATPSGPAFSSWSDFLESGVGVRADPVRLPFDTPQFILYSSGTTGPPKCIIHRAGGLLLTHLKEHKLHCDVRPGDRVFYYTTTGWMMWNWLLGALASGATLVVYDGSPTHPTPLSLFDLVDEYGITLFGTSARYLDTLRRAGHVPASGRSLATLRTITSTGSPLAAEAFDWVYQAVKPDVHLASISGGTDICGCFVLGDPTRPVYRGEIQGPALGMAVDVFDEEGRPAAVGQTGELVCTRPFPSLPLGFWGDPDRSRYTAAYFSRYPGVWRHGDWITRTHHGGLVISGRSDATLNPGGVRIGTAEIYRQLDRFPQITDAVAIGREVDGDQRIVLFVVLAPGAQLTEDLVEEIKKAIRTNCSPRHVPARILAVPDVPRTHSGKIAELAVRDAVHGRPVRGTEALANPECLAYFRDHPELA
ncbi:MAG: acetoacetate--CoA ligase [Acidothermus sp.]|nr:acetoacetate--CoA ligase [Acidothermus sp.]